MSGIDDYKITDTTGSKIGDLPGSSLSGTVQDNKEAFDKLGELIISHYNDLIDYVKSNILQTQVTFNEVYPVGSIYMSVKSTNPTTLFGGTWIRLQDTFLLAAGSTYEADSEEYTTAQHGSADATVPSHCHYFEDQETNPAGAHSHYVYQGSALMGSPSSGGGYFAKSSYASTHYSYPLDRNAGAYELKTNTQSAHIHTISGKTLNTGESNTGKNMPPYLAVYVWKRTA